MQAPFAFFVGCTSLVGVWASYSTTSRASAIEEDETIVFFPTLAYQPVEGGPWIAQVHGWIFEVETDSWLRAASLAGFCSLLGLEAEQAETLVFQQRARPFVVDNERGKRISIRIGTSSFELEPSAEDGHFFGTVRVDARIADRVARDGWLRYTAVLAPRDSREFAGQIRLLEPSGVSVISDIDDTVKVSEVLDRRKLIQNTFLLPFREVAGMAELYRDWARRGAAFHFVSASPWQLYEPLADFAQQAGFPPSTYHLRRVRLKDRSVLSLLADPLTAKLQVIEPLLATYPRRRLILVGDSGERDPEVYGRLAEGHPEQVLRIYIRNVTGQAADAPRYQAAFGPLPRDKWQIFDEPSEISCPF
jgi:hypothetical protein